MKRQSLNILMALLFVLPAGMALAQDEPIHEPGTGPGQGNGVCQFIDEDGDGFNDLAPDHDGDGIPNGLDPDYVRPEDGTGQQHQHQLGALSRQQLGRLAHLFDPAFADLAVEGAGGNGHMFGLRDGTGTGFGPADGTGFGPGAGDGGGDGTGSGGTGGPGGNGINNGRHGNGQGGRR